MELTTSVALITPLIIFFVFIKKWQKSEAACGGLPPGPKKVPIIGDLHLISQPYFRCLRDLAIQYGPIMHLKLGEVDTVVVSSPEIAKEILKDNDPIFTDRPESIALKIFWYNYINITFQPYGEYWKQMRNICIAQLLSTKSVRSFASIRRGEVARLLHSVRLSAGSPMNLTEKIFSLMSTVICRAEFGMPCYDEAETLTKLQREALEMSTGFLIADMFPSSKIAGALSWGTKLKLLRMRRELDVILDDIIHHHQTDRRGSGDEDLVDVLLRVKESGELKFPIGYDNIKAVLLDMFSGGNETSSSTVNWAMAELLRNPEIMAKVQAEVRQVVNARSNNNNSIDEEDVQTMKYLKLVIMETHRLHPTISVIPRLSREACQISGYDIPKKFKVLVNLWAIQRDPEYWPDPETFKPERFQNQSSLDFKGNDFRYLPFGSGKRVCPGTLFGSAIVALTLAHLLYEFNWKLPEGVDAQALDMTENYGIATSRREHLFVVATPYQLSPP